MLATRSLGKEHSEDACAYTAVGCSILDPPIFRVGAFCGFTTVFFLTILGIGGMPGPVLADGPGEPTSFTTVMRPVEDVARVQTEPLDLNAIRAEDEARERQRGVPYRFAIQRTVRITPETGGTWEQIDDDTRLWRIRVTCPQATSINLGFTRYHMPRGGSMSVYSTDHMELLGPFTDNDNAHHGQLWAPVIYSDDIVVELTIPTSAIPQLELELTAINHGYRPLNGSRSVGCSGESGWCNENVACPTGDPWRDQIRSVGGYTVNGAYWCTGSLINNTSQDCTPFFLTAFHCFDEDGDGTIDDTEEDSAASVVVYWNHQASWCDGSGKDQTRTQSGADLLASFCDSDFALLRLHDEPPAEANAYYAGWDRTGSAPSSGVAIHHPSADCKMISFEHDPLFIDSDFSWCWDCFGNQSCGNHLVVGDWDLGTTEGGSSGCPLFNPAGRIVGQLHGGVAACGNDDPDWFGRLYTSWTGGGTRGTSLRDHLDPMRDEPPSLNGRDAPSDSETICDDGIDNDCDGQTDCADPDCACDLACAAASEVGLCADGIDNDCDTDTDCADADCACDPDCVPPSSEAGFCSDGIDNDCDGPIDCADPDCQPCCGDSTCDPDENPCTCESDCGSPECCTDGECDDQIECTDDTCVEGSCVFTPHDGNCDDGKDCTSDVCDPEDGDRDASGCVYTTNLGRCLISHSCYGDGDLNPANDCEWCDADRDQNAWRSRDIEVPCGEGPAACSDQDTCDGEGYCDPRHKDEGLPCDDGRYCNGSDTCSAGTCSIHSGDPCDPDQCCYEPGDECRDVDLCSVPADCDDENACTTYTCADGCCENLPICTTPDDCDDGNPCTNNVCLASGCCDFPPSCTTGADCDDGNPCTQDVCSDGCCAHPPACASDADCNDGNACTTNTCPDGCCTSSAVQCDDGDPCNGVETCDSANGCQPGTALDCDDGNVCTADSCDAGSGCVHDGTNITLACDDGNECTTTDVCQGDADGTCKGTDTSATDCDDNNPCTVDSCSAAAGCIHDGTGVTGSCDDDNDCTINDLCQGDQRGTCAGTDGSAAKCDDDNPCTVDSCDRDAGCEHNGFDVTQACDDGDICTLNDLCQGDLDGTCAGTPDDCDDGNPCTVNACDPKTGCISLPSSAAGCDDDLFCNGKEFCRDGVCFEGVRPCGPGEVCDEGSESCTELEIRTSDTWRRGEESCFEAWLATRRVTVAWTITFVADGQPVEPGVAPEPGGEACFTVPDIGAMTCEVAATRERANVTASLTFSTPWELVVQPSYSERLVPATTHSDGALAAARVPDPPPEGDLRFVRWEGDVPAGQETADSLLIMMDSDKEVTAVFAQAAGSASGSGSGGQSSCGGCGAFGTIGWSLLLLGLMAFRFVGPRKLGVP